MTFKGAEDEQKHRSTAYADRFIQIIQLGTAPLIPQTDRIFFKDSQSEAISVPQ